LPQFAFCKLFFSSFRKEKSKSTRGCDKICEKKMVSLKAKERILRNQEKRLKNGRYLKSIISRTHTNSLP
jgi:hypothetical protein